MPQAKHWCFTLNNYTDDDQLSSLPSFLTYCLYGREVSGTGTPHLQGICSFRTKLRSPSSKLFDGRAHWEVCRSLPASIVYCKKDGDWVELGKSTKNPGKRSDLCAFKEAVRAGVLSLSEIRENYSEVYARYPRFVLEYLKQHEAPVELEDHPLRNWQQLLLDSIMGEVSPREVTFVIDEKGNGGKTWFSSYVRKLLPEKVFLCLPGKKSDMVYALNTLGFKPTVCIIDAPRSKQGEFLQYDFLEELKNGRVFNTKYESCMIEFKPPHVIVMMNEMPDMTKLSEDRYKLIVL